MRHKTSIIQLTYGAKYRTYNETEIEFWKKNYYLIWHLHEVLTGNYAVVINEKIWDLMYLLIKICYIHDTSVPNLLSAAVPNVFRFFSQMHLMSYSCCMLKTDFPLMLVSKTHGNIFIEKLGTEEPRPFSGI